MLDTASPNLCGVLQLRNCAKWHERQAHRNPARAKHHNETAAGLRVRANAMVRYTSGAINSKGF
jgi:hypothetical protein